MPVGITSGSDNLKRLYSLRRNHLHLPHSFDARSGTNHPGHRTAVTFLDFNLKREELASYGLIVPLLDAGLAPVAQVDVLSGYARTGRA